MLWSHRWSFDDISSPLKENTARRVLVYLGTDLLFGLVASHLLHYLMHSSALGCPSPSWLKGSRPLSLRSFLPCPIFLFAARANGPAGLGHNGPPQSCPSQRVCDIVEVRISVGMGYSGLGYRGGGGTISHKFQISEKKGPTDMQTHKVGLSLKEGKIQTSQNRPDQTKPDKARQVQKRPH